MKGLSLTLATTLLVTLLAGGAAALEPEKPVVQVREAYAPGVELQVTTTNHLGCERSIVMEVALTNTGSAPLELPGDGPEAGLRFFLRDEAGYLFDEGTPLGVLSVGTLGAGETRWTRIDLGHRPLVRVENHAFVGGRRYSGLLDPKLLRQPSVELYLHQLAGEHALEIDPVHIALDPPRAMERSNFLALHGLAGAPEVWDPDMPVVPPDAYAKGRVLVVFREHVDLEAAADTVDHQGFRVGTDQLFGNLRMLVVLVPEGEEKDAVKRFRKLRCVADAQLDHLATIM